MHGIDLWSQARLGGQHPGDLSGRQPRTKRPTDVLRDSRGRLQLLLSIRLTPPLERPQDSP
jgi:hypothetical protein